MLHLVNTVAILNRTAKQKQVSTVVRNTKFVRQCLQKLMELGFLRGFVILDSYRATVYLKFDSNNNPVIRSLKCVTKPGKRVYVKYDSFKKLNTSVNISSGNTLVLSTSFGLKTMKEALMLKLGGEALFIVN